MNRSTRLWLEGELPRLVEEGVVPDDVARHIRARYAAEAPTSRMPLAFAVCGVLGAALIGLGIILLFAHNWEDLGRPVRAGLSFAPLLVAQGLVGYTVLRKRTSLAWTESTGLFLVLMVGACIALISQTYQISGRLDSFLLMWALLGLPIIYLLDARLSAILYVVAVVVWGLHEGNHFRGFEKQIEMNPAFWALMGLFAPYVYALYRKRPRGVRVALLSWAIAIGLCFAVGQTLAESMKGAWMPAFAGLLATFHLAVAAKEDERTEAWKRAYSFVGLVGAMILLAIMTDDFAWDRLEAGWSRTYGDNSVMDWVLQIGLPIGALGLMGLRLRLGIPEVALTGGTVLMSLAGCALGMAGYGIVAIAAMNIFMLVVALFIVARGLAAMQLLRVNLGLVVLVGWIVARFFDWDIEAFARGLMFIALGIVILSTNLVLLRRQRKGGVS